MVFVKILGLGDLISAILIVLKHFSLIGWNIALIPFFYLAVKGLAFRGSFLSVLDLVVAGYALLLAFGVSFWFTWVAVAILLYKFFVGLF